jgi:hypothetical protein
MEMSNPSGGRRNFSPRVSDNPPKVTLRLGPISLVSHQNLGSEKNALNRTEQLMAQRIPATEKKSDHGIVDGYNKGCIRLTSKIIIGKEIREQISIFEYLVDRLTEKPGLAANLTYGSAIVPAVSADYERLDADCVHQLLSSR